MPGAQVIGVALRDHAAVAHQYDTVQQRLEVVHEMRGDEPPN
ncbi:hypothetical protein [Dietzia alimentaria]|nr:hypothetical protein [Dietzia alimentaria]